MDWIDPRNKGYGLNYTNKTERPEYSRDGLMALCTPEKVEADRQNMMRILDNWKAKQKKTKTTACCSQHQWRWTPECYIYHECFAGARQPHQWTHHG